MTPAQLPALLALTLTVCVTPLAQETQLPDIFEQVRRSVVTVTAYSRAMEATGAAIPGGQPLVALGSGVLITASGRVLTSAHLLDGADTVTVAFADGPDLVAMIVDQDPNVDLALLQVIDSLSSDATVASFGDSSRVRIGDAAFVVGAPLGLTHTLTVGHISARRSGSMMPGIMQSIEHFQTDAAINQGNSGGPMFDMQGELIGIVCHLVSKSGANAGLGFVITSNAIHDEFLDKERVWLGVDALPLSPAVGQALNVPDGLTGMLVQTVTKGSMADQMGIRGGSIPVTIRGVDILLGGDIIVTVQGQFLRDLADVTAALSTLSSLQDGSVLRISVLRAGETVDVEGVWHRP